MPNFPASAPALSPLRRLGYGLAQALLLGAWLTGRLRAWQHGLHGADAAALTPPPAAQ